MYTGEPAEVRDVVLRVQALVFCRLQPYCLADSAGLAATLGRLALGLLHASADRLVASRLGRLGGRPTTRGTALCALQLGLGAARLVVEALHGADGVAEVTGLASGEVVERAQAQGLQHVLRQDAGLSEARLERGLTGGLQGAHVVLVEDVPASQRLAGGQVLAVAVGHPLVGVGGVELQECGALPGQDLRVGLVGLQGFGELRETDQGIAPM